jgi:hypothetical protein
MATPKQIKYIAYIFTFRPGEKLKEFKKCIWDAVKQIEQADPHQTERLIRALEEDNVARVEAIFRELKIAIHTPEEVDRLKAEHHRRCEEAIAKKYGIERR